MTASGVQVRARTRVLPVPPVEPALLTVAFDITVVDPQRMLSVTRSVLSLRGLSPEEVEERISIDGHPDLTACLKALMEESVSALGVSTGAVIGEIDAFAEPPAV